jgi:hypothetical protein
MMKSPKCVLFTENQRNKIPGLLSQGFFTLYGKTVYFQKKETKQPEENNVRRRIHEKDKKESNMGCHSRICYRVFPDQ